MKALLSAGVLKGISVGFVPVEHKPLDNKGGGYHYLRQKLIEASLVSVPANPAALLTAKALGVSRQTIDIVFKQSDTSSTAKRIRDYRRSIRKLRDRIATATNPRTRASLTRSLAHLENAERELRSRLSQQSSAADRRRAEERAQDRDLDRLIAQYEASPAGQAQRHTDETIAAYTRENQRLPQDPPPYVPKGENFTTWRGQKIDLRLTWRGKKI